MNENGLIYSLLTQNFSKYTGKIFYYLLCMMFVMQAVVFISCGEEPVAVIPSSPIIDTVDYYNWSLDTIWDYSTGQIYVADTNSVFLDGGRFMIHHEGTTNTVIYYSDPNFLNYSISGYNNTVFLGGKSTIEKKPELLIWKNGIFEKYIIQDDSNITAIDYLLAENENELWLTSDISSVYHYQFNIFTKYITDSLIGLGFLFKNLQGILYLFSYRVYENHANNFAYRFENGKFEFISFDTTNSSTEMGSYINKCGTDLIRIGNNAIFVWENEKWIKLCNTPDFNVKTINGTSRDSLIAYGRTNYGSGFFLWNGKKWNLEKNYKAPQIPLHIASRLELEKSYVFLNFNNFEWNTSFLVIGKPKTGKEVGNVKTSLR